jgi:surfactin synthase thioesterase subunit
VALKGRRAEALSSRIRSLVQAIQENDEAQIEAAVLRLTGVLLGALLAFSTTIVTRWGRPWFTISLGVTVL